MLMERLKEQHIKSLPADPRPRPRRGQQMEVSGLETSRERKNRPKRQSVLQMSQICVCEDEEAVDYGTNAGNHQGAESGSHDKMTPQRTNSTSLSRLFISCRPPPIT